MSTDLSNLKFSLHKKEEVISALEVVLNTANSVELCGRILSETCKENGLEACRKTYIDIAINLGVTFNEELPINKANMSVVEKPINNVVEGDMNNRKFVTLCLFLGALCGVVAGSGYAMARQSYIFLAYGTGIGALAGAVLSVVGILLSKLQNKDIEIMKS